MRARDRELPQGPGAEHGVATGLVGIGDVLPRVPSTIEAALDGARRHHGPKAEAMLERFTQIPDGAFVWTRDSDGLHHLGRIAGSWRYDDTPDTHRYGIHHVRPARWLERVFGPDDVPAGVLASFARGGRNLQRISGDAIDEQTAALWTAEQGALRAPLTIAMAQPVCVARDVAANAEAHAAAVEDAHARLVIFPELSLTGYELDAPLLEPDDRRLDPLFYACVLTNTIALVGAPVRGPAGTAHIATIAVSKNGIEVVYRKQYPGDEEQPRFSAGAAPAAIDVDGWRIGLGICRDTGVPDQVAATADLGIQVYAAGTVMHPEEGDKQDARGAGIAELHGIYSAFASFAGPTGSGYDQTAGRSTIWSPGGHVVGNADAQPGSTARAVLV